MPLPKQGAESTSALLDMCVLEERILFSASPIPLLVEDLGDVAEHIDFDGIDDALAAIELNGSENELPDTLPAVDVTPLEVDGQLDSLAQGLTERHELLVIDASVPDYKTLLTELQTELAAAKDTRIEILVLDDRTDGIQAITDVLHASSNWDAVHIVSHGRPGEVQLGGEVLSGESLVTHLGQLASWNDALKPEADLLIYGCDVAGGEFGEQFIEALHELTGADVAASNDLTGTSELGGDWDFEFVVGELSMYEFQVEWFGVLTTETFSEGTAGYAGTQDTHIASGEPTSTHDASFVSVDLSDGALGTSQGLIKFDNIIGGGPNQIPVGATITSVSLAIQTTNESEGIISLHQALVSWDETATWNSLIGGIDTDGFEFAADPDDTVDGPTNGWTTFTGPGLVATVQSWVDGIDPNEGWGLVSDSVDGWDFNSSEHATISLRPQLSVTYTTNRIVVDTSEDYVAADAKYGDTSTISSLLADRGTDGLISLREAIDATNNTPNGATPDEIQFNIATSDVGYIDPDATPGNGDEYWVIAPISHLGDILDAVIIDATTQAGYATPVIELDGSSATGASAAFNLRTSDSLIRGFAIHSFPDEGIEIDGTLTAGVADSNVIEGNWIGLDAEGNAAGVGDDGILITDGASNNTIRNNIISDSGGDGILIRENVIAGTSNNIVYGNYIGTDVTGTSDMGNAGYGIQIADAFNNIIGSAVLAERNVISGNDLTGISIWSSLSTGNTVIGNYIGTNAAGTGAIGNSDDGIRIGGGANANTIGDDRTAGEGNVISGNDDDGIEIVDESSDSNYIYGNIIGLDASGTSSIGNLDDGVFVGNSPDNIQIGGTGAGRGNVISGNLGDGIHISGALTTSVDVINNFVGTDITGTVDLGNQENGVLLDGGANNSEIGDGTAAGRNVISGNEAQGVYITSGSSDNRVRGNYIGTDVTGAIDLGNTGNGIAVNGGSDNTIIGELGAGNVISGNDGNGLFASSVAGLVIQGNYIGTDSSGTNAIGNVTNGVNLAVSGAQIGGTTAGEGNVISGNTGEGVEIQAAGTANRVEGNIIGLDANGTTVVGNTGHGVYIYSGANGNFIGGTVAGARNVISGNNYGVYISGLGSDGNIVEGNYIGTDITGTLDRGNSASGVRISSGANNTIGGSSAAARNIISGNDGSGVLISGVSATGNLVQGNYIGTDVSGSLDVGNSQHGVWISSASSNMIDGNVVSGNDVYGIYVSGASTTGTLITGNLVGTDAAGAELLLNGDDGLYLNAVDGTIVGGNTAATRNIINTAFGDYGVYTFSSSNTTIQGNYIGTDITGTAALAGGSFALNISDSSSTTIGGSTLAKANVIGGYSVTGINVSGASSVGTAIQGNFIGTDASGALDLTSGIYGITLQLGATGILIGGPAAGQGNTIANHGTNGIRLMGTAGNSNPIRRNLIYGSGGIGIDLAGDGVTANDGGDGDAGPNQLMNSPVIYRATFSGGNVIITGEARPGATVEFFKVAVDGDSHGEAIALIGSGLVSGSTPGIDDPTAVQFSFSFAIGSLVDTDMITATATATDAADNSSEFSANVDINSAPVLDNTGLMDLPNVFKNTIDPSGESVAAIVASAGGNRITDSDMSSVEGMAVTSVDDTNGTWEYSINGGVTWTPFGAVTNSNAVVLTDTASDRIRFVPGTDYTGTATFTFRAWDTTDGNTSGTTGVDTGAGGGTTAYSSSTENVSVFVEPTEIFFWYSTLGDVGPTGGSGGGPPSGTPGLANWSEGEVIGFGDPNRAFGTATDGTFLSVSDFDLLAADSDVDLVGLHYVASDITVAGSGISGGSVDLEKGDLIFVTLDDETLSNSAVGAPVGWSNAMATNAGDVYVFRSENTGDYSSGYFRLILNDPSSNQLAAVSLIEKLTLVGDTWLAPGDFLFSQTGNFDDNDVSWYDTSANSSVKLIEGDDLGISRGIDGLQVIDEGQNFGGVAIGPGTIFLSLDQADTIGTNNLPVGEHDVVELEMTTTTWGSGLADASAEMIFEGGDVGLDHAREDIDALTLVVRGIGVNQPPTLARSGPIANYAENGPPVLIDSTITVVDGDSADFASGVLRVDIAAGADANDRLHVFHQGSGSGQIGVTKNTVTYEGVTIGTFSGGHGTDPLVFSLNASADAISTRALMRNITFHSVSDNPGMTTRAVEFTLTDGDGGTSNTILAFVNVSVNADIPVAVDDYHGLDFDGVDDYVAIADSPSLTMTNALTMEAWINPDTSTNVNRMIINKEGEYEVALFPNDRIYWAFANTDPGWVWHDTGYTVTNGEWTHIAVTYDNGTVSTYVNGTLVDVYSGSGSLGDAHPTLDDLRIGGRSNNPAGKFFDGRIDEVRIWNTARTQAEILANLDANLTGSESGLAGYWNFNEGTGATANDPTAGSNTGTLVDGGAGFAGPQWTGYTTDQNTAINVTAASGIVSNDVDGDDDPLTITQVNGSAANVGSMITLASGANLTVSSLGAFIYDPNGAFDHLAVGETAVDSFTYQIDDGNGNTDDATAHVKIIGTNFAPIVDLNGVDESGTGFVATFNEGDIPLFVSDSDAIISDSADKAFLSLSVSLALGFDATNEQVTIGGYTFTYGSPDVAVVTVGATDFQVSFDGTGFNIDNNVGGTMPIADLELLIREITYENTSQNPTVGVRVIEFVATDAGGLTGPIARSTISVNAVNDDPVAVNDAFATDEDTPYMATLGVNDLLLNDADLDGDTLTVNTTPVSGPSNGTLVLNGDGTFTYTPNAHFHGSDSFVYEVSDGNGGTAQATVNITVNPINDNPVAVNDAFATDEDTPYTATLGVNDLLLNDTDLDGDTLTVNTTPVSGPSNGTLVLNGDGTFTYTPNANFSGSDSFVYEVSDGNGGTAQATVNITVNPINDDPVAVNDAFATDEDTPYTATLGVNDLLLNDTDLDGDTLTVNTTPVSGPSNGTLVLNGDGTFRYTPNAHFHGSDSFVYEVSDGNGATAQASVDITINPINDNPLAVNDAFATDEDTPYTTTLGVNDLLLNDTDLDGDTLTVNTTPVSGPSNGTLVLNADGTFTYTPNAHFHGSDSFVYEVSDGNGGTAQATVNITVNPVNDDPVAVNDAIATDEDTPYTATLGVNDLLLNDTDLDGDTLTVNTTPVSGPSNGTLVLNADGTFSYTPNAHFHGSDSFVYEVSDGNGGTAQATVNITVNPVNDDPVAVNDAFTTDEDTPYTATMGVNDLLLNDTDLDGDMLMVNTTPVSGPSNGTLVLNADGTFTYTPNANFSGSDSFVYEVSDGNGGTAQASVDITINPINDNPLAVNDAFATDEDTPYTATLGVNDLLLNDTDPDGDTLTVNTTPVSGPSNGTLVLNGDGTFTYTPNATFNGSDSFVYEVSDGNGGTARATVNITVNPINDDPLAVNDAFATDEDTPYTATLGVNDLLLNDTDLDGDTLTVNTTPVSGPSNGTLVLNGDGTFTYTPNAHFHGSDSFVYEVSDGNGGTARATVNITVNPINDDPVAVHDAFATDEDTPYTATLGVNDLLLNDTDLDGDMLTVNTTPVSGPSNGTLLLNADGTFSYTPNAHFHGSDSFVYEVSDGNGGMAQATVNITVNPINDDPVAANDAFATDEDTPYTATLGVNDLLLNDMDLDGDTLTVNTTPVIGTSNGTLVLNGDGSFTYTPNANFSGSDSFVYEVSDGNGGTAQATVNITVNPINDDPVAVNDAFATDEDTPYTATLGVNDLLLNDMDLDGDTLTVNTTPVSGPSNGTLLLNGDGTFTYTPNANFSGSDSFVYEVSDGNGGTAQATVNITVNLINDDPVAANDAFATDEDAPYTATLGVNDLLLNDTDLDGDTLTVNTTPVIGPSNGTLVLNGDGSFTYTPNANFSGSDSFVYEVSDGNGGMAQATVNITVNPINDDPVAANDAFATDEDAPYTATLGVNDLLLNDTDLDGDTLTVNTTPVSGPSNGTLVLNGDGTFTYTPNANFNGSDSFVYEVSDGNGGTAQATVNIIVDNVNVRPVAVADNYTVNEGERLDVSAIEGVLANDVDADGGRLTVSIVSGPTNGTLTLDDDGSFTYLHHGSTTATDRFLYELDDGNGGISTATVEIVVNSTPESNPDDAMGLFGETVNGNVLTNDVDADLDALTATVVDGPRHGTLTLNGDGSFTYTPSAGFVGFDEFTYVATDGLATSDVTTVEVTVAFPTENSGDRSDEGSPPGNDTTTEDNSDQDDFALPVLIPTLNDANDDAVTDASQTVSDRDGPRDGITRIEGLEISTLSDPNEYVSYYGTTVLSIDDLVQVVRTTPAIASQLVHPPLATAWFWEQMSGVAEQLKQNETTADLAQVVFQASATALSVGYVIWSVRSGYLLATMLSSLPAWRRFDPLPILDFAAARKRDKESKNPDGGTLVENILGEQQLATQ